LGWDALELPAPPDERAGRAERNHHLRHAEGGHVADHLRLLLGELEHADVAEQLRVELGVELQRAGAARPDEPLAVERDPGAARQRRHRLGREVRAGERRDVHPSREPGLARLTARPGLAELVDHHAADAVLVGEREARRRRGRPPGDGDAERGDLAHEAPVARSALRRDPRRGADHAKRPCRVVRGAAGPRRAAVDDVPREVAEHREGAHGAGA